MAKRVLVNRPGPDPKGDGLREPYDFGRIPVVGESVKLGEDIPMFRVIYVLHTPLDQDASAEIFVEVNDHFEKASGKAAKLLPGSE